MAATSLRAAVEEAAARDPVLADLVARAGPLTHRPRDPDGPFGALVRAIVFQQLAGRAAQAIYGRVRVAVGGSFTPEAFGGVSDEALRAAGLSATSSRRCATCRRRSWTARSSSPARRAAATTS